MKILVSFLVTNLLVAGCGSIPPAGNLAGAPVPGDQGPQGLTGAQGPQGIPGVPGDPSVLSWARINDVAEILQSGGPISIASSMHLTEGRYRITYDASRSGVFHPIVGNPVVLVTGFGADLGSTLSATAVGTQEYFEDFENRLSFEVTTLIVADARDVISPFDLIFTIVLFGER